MVLVDFRSTTIWHAFLLNSLAASLAIVVAIFVKMRYDRYVDKDGNEIHEITSTKSMLLTFGATFIATFVAYSTLHFLFGYGGGQLSR